LGGAQIPATQSKPTGLQMPAFNEKLTDAQIAAVVTYIRSAWGNRASIASKSDVAKLRRQMKQ
jgi:mono/diheme cytochrome c family protein